MSTIQYLPIHLDKKNLVDLAFIMQNEKTKKIIKLLLEKDEAHLNAIQNLVAGSKTTTFEVLEILEDRNIIQSDWKLEAVTDRSMKKRQFAVRVFRISDKLRKLLEVYKPLITTPADRTSQAHH